MSVIPATLRGVPPRLDAAVPAVHLLGNGRYSVWLTEAGMGRSSWQGNALSRWSGDRVEDAEGWRIWLRDLDLGRSWPVLQPSSSRRPARGLVTAGPGVFGWLQRDHGIETRLDVCVAPGHDVELRSITVKNLSGRSRWIDLTGCLELVLQDPGADAAHPAFSKLFVQTVFDPVRQQLVATRRPRGASDQHPSVAHALVGEGAFSCETDRGRFLGRGRSWHRPAALASIRALSGTVGSVLDPVFATRRAAVLAPGERRRWTFVLAAGPDSEQALVTLARFGSDEAIENALSEASVHARAELERLGLGLEDAEAFDRLSGVLLYGDPRLRAEDETLRHAGDDARVRATLGIPALAPLVVLRGDEPGAGVEWERMRRATGWWRAHGIAAELVGVGGALGAPADEPGVHVVCALDEHARRALEAGARIVVREATRPLLRNLHPDAPAPARQPAAARPSAPARHRPPRREHEPLQMFNGFGGFTRDGREYVIHLDALRHGGHRRPPLPWVNVIANERFGTLVTESGAGFTWSGNSREHRLTPWSNDPLLDPHGEALYVVDDATGAAWSPLPGPLPHASSYETRHGLGYSRFLLDAESVAHDTLVTVDRDAPVKIVRVRLRNTGSVLKRLSLVCFTRLVLGADDASACRVVTERDARTGALLARNAASGPWSEAIAFSQVLTADSAAFQVTTDRARFLGRHGDPSRPAALHGALAFDGATGPMHDPCFAWHVTFEVPAGESVDTVFLLGEARDEADLRSLLTRFETPGAAEAAATDTRAAWDALVSRVRVETPAPELDLMVNAWLPYQTLSCRLWGRSGFYQSGGAFGFRDQLQDALSLLSLAPERAREQILLHANHQFVEGDVLHWWHPPLSQGMRTRFADDLLWLPHLLATYVSVTGDAGVLEEQTAFMSARVLTPGEDEAYVRPAPSDERASIYEHAARAIDRSLEVGEHGLPLFGCGDWNDGMNRVGREGRGESVWMGWFLSAILDAWAPLAESRADSERASRWRTHRDALARALEAEAWDGDWYRRGWYDNGVPLGSRDSDECRIDALAQAWSVISGVAPRARAERAMVAVEEFLVSEREGLIRLLTPPFEHTLEDPGYIKGYVAGVRENGGQYTHAALWVVRAFAELGRRDLAARLLCMLSPVSHARDNEAARRYKVEPYVIAADVYGVEPHVGRGGWTWYTGSSGWMYRVALESVLGVRLEGGRQLTVQPCIPDEWEGFRMAWQLPGASGTSVEIVVRNPQHCSATVVSATYDDSPLEIARGQACVSLPADGAAHRLEVTLGAGG